MRQKRILVISHNVLSKTTSMGKTLLSYFDGYEPEQLAQFYIHSEVPTISACTNYYRITDKEMIKSIITHKSGAIFHANDIQNCLTDPRTDKGLTGRLYQKARIRTPIIYFFRNMWWKLGTWKTQKFKEWLIDFSPDVVFFASGDYSFMYDIALFSARYCKVPLLVDCMDDYYLNNKNEKKIFGEITHKTFMKHVKKTMIYASGLFTICDKMNKEYAKLFNKNCNVLHTATTLREPLSIPKLIKISYIGNLGYHRNEQLIQIGRALKEIHSPVVPKVVDVYSSEKRDEILHDFTVENGIVFHGQICAEEVKQVIGESLVVIHTESFYETDKKAVGYSVSTKIADSLASGTCLLAYGPAEIASIDYLFKNQAAYCITSNDKLKDGIVELFTNMSLRNNIIDNALALASKNHNKKANHTLINHVIDGVTLNENITSQQRV